MSDDLRLRTVLGLLREHVASPSVRHIRDPYQLSSLASKILKALDGARDPWRKWPSARDMLIRKASGCWIPMDDLHAALAELPAPPLTKADVTGRRLALWEDGLDRREDTYPAGCEALYARERSAGTELAAIIELMDDWVGEETSRRFTQEWEERTHRRAEMKAAAEQAFLSGADSKSTQIGSSPDLYCRVNGRTYRLSRAPDKKLEVRRVQSLSDARPFPRVNVGQDLRDRVLAAADEPIRAVAARFGVSPSYVSKAWSRFRRIGEVTPGPQHNHAGSDRTPPFAHGL